MAFESYKETTKGSCIELQFHNHENMKLRMLKCLLPLDISVSVVFMDSLETFSGMFNEFINKYNSKVYDNYLCYDISLNNNVVLFEMFKQ